MMSRPSGPLITLDPTDDATEAPRPGMPHGKSVFGVDELWERDMRRLEALRAEEARVEAGKLSGKEKEKRRSGRAESVHPHTETLHERGRDDTHVPPSISLGDLSAALAPEPHRNVTVDEWAAGSDEEAAGEPRRRRRRAKAVPKDEESSEDEVPLARAFGITRRPAGDESSEDEPLVNLVRRRTV